MIMDYDDINDVSFTKTGLKPISESAEHRMGNKYYTQLFFAKLGFTREIDFEMLSGFPAEICNIPKLKTLRIRHSQIKTIPSEIERLKNLEFLSLKANSVEELPKELFLLENLKGLDLASNMITSIPPEIGNLRRLEVLIVTDNQLTELPDEICRLKNLKKLVSNRNFLSELPKNIDQLNNLELLMVDDNEIMPEEIGRLNQLNDKTKVISGGNISEEMAQDLSHVRYFRRHISSKYHIRRIDRHSVSVCDINTGKLINTFKGCTYEYNRLDDCSVSPDEKYLIAVDNDCEDYGAIGDLLGWEIESGRAKKISVEGSNGLSRITFSDDGKYVKVKQYSSNAIVWDLETGNVVFNRRSKRQRWRSEHVEI